MAEDVRRSAELTRRPEPELEVIWQQHIPQGVGEADSDERLAAVYSLVPNLIEAFEEYAYGDLLDSADLVLTLSKRKM